MEFIKKSSLSVILVLIGFRVQAENPALVETARFHHVHLNATDPAKTIKYYEKFFSAVPVKYHDASDALLTNLSFILLAKVPSPAPSDLRSAIYHIGWGGIDGPAEFEWRKKEGMEFETPVRPLGPYHYMYAYGPDRELIEVWTGFKHNRFGHVHLLAEDVNATTHWYMDQLGLKGTRRDFPKPPPPKEDTQGAKIASLWASQVTSANVTINIFEKPGDPKPIFWTYDPIKDFEPTRGRVVDHLAFSYPSIEPVFERMKASGVQIVEPITLKDEYKMKSFFVMGPDKVLIEIVEDKPLPEGIWR